MQNELGLRSKKGVETTVHPRLSDTLIIRTQNFTSHTRIYKSHLGCDDFDILHFPIVKAMLSSVNVSIIEDICKLMADPIRGATEVDDQL